MEYLTECLACNSTDFKAFEQTIAMMHQNLPAKYNFDRCNACGLVFLNPRVAETELGQFYTASYLPYRVEEAWGKYASFVKQDQRKIDKARVERLIKHSKPSMQSRIMDIGCGKPTFLASLRNSIQANLIGLDFSDEGWKNDRDSYHNIDLRTGEIDLRSKRKLIEKFIQENLPKIDNADNIQDEFEKYWQEQKILALNALCEEEHLDKEQFKALIEAYIFSGQDPLRDEVLKCLGNRPSIFQAREIGERIIYKMKEYFEVFEMGMVA